MSWDRMPGTGTEVPTIGEFLAGNPVPGADTTAPTSRSHVIFPRSAVNSIHTMWVTLWVTELTWRLTVGEPLRFPKMTYHVPLPCPGDKPQGELPKGSLCPLLSRPSGYKVPDPWVLTGTWERAGSSWGVLGSSSRAPSSLLVSHERLEGQKPWR